MGLIEIYIVVVGIIFVIWFLLVANMYLKLKGR